MLKKALFTSVALSVSMVGLVNLNPVLAVLTDCPPNEQALIIREGHHKYMIMKSTGEVINIEGHAEPKPQHATVTPGPKEHKLTITEPQKPQRALISAAPLHADAPHKQVLLEAGKRVTEPKKELATAAPLKTDDVNDQRLLQAGKRVAEPKKELATAAPLKTDDVNEQKLLQADRKLLAPAPAAVAAPSASQQRLLDQAKKLADATAKMTESATTKPE